MSVTIPAAKDESWPLSMLSVLTAFDLSHAFCLITPLTMASHSSSGYTWAPAARPPTKCDVGVSSFTSYAQLIGDAAATRHEPNRLVTQSNIAALLVDVGHQVEAAHVALDNSDGRLLR